MNINEFNQRVHVHQKTTNQNEPENVYIMVGGSSIGGTPAVGVDCVVRGIDWDHGKIFIVPSEPLVKKKSYSTVEQDFIVRALERGYKYICRCGNGDIIVSSEIPIRTTRSWKYSKKNSERTSLYRNDFKKLTFENGGVMALSSLLIVEDE